jgi:amino acid transporter
MVLRRTLGLFDVTLFFIVACTNLQWVAAAAAAGASSISVWLISCACMFLPLSFCVMRLSARYPEEGGMYVWSKRAFGPFAGFMTGWTYWCSNLPYFPALLYFTAGNLLFAGGANAQHLSASPAYFILASLAFFAIATLLNVIGLDVGKWLNNAGGIGRWIVTLLLICLGIFAWLHFGSATPITAQTIRPSVALKDLIFWSVIAFAWTGPEAVPFLAGEVRDAPRTIPRGLALAAPAILVIYVAGTVSVLATLSPAHVSSLFGVMQAIGAVCARIGWSVLVPVAALLVTISCLGSVSFWLGAVARIPFVAGIDRYLPPSFARTNPRTGAPVVAILAQAGISALFILLGQGGTSVSGAYEVLVGATVLITLIPFLYVFSAALKLHADQPGVLIAGVVGLLTTASAMLLALFPSANETNKALAVAKIVGSAIVVLLVGTVVYFNNRNTLCHAEVSKRP